MEWIELLKMLSQQQADQVTQQQFDALTDGVFMMFKAFIIVFLVVLIFDTIFYALQDRRIRKLEAIISQLDSMNFQKADVEG